MRAFSPPCATCKERYVGCHSECVKYAEFKAKLDVIREIKMKENEKLGEILRYNRGRPKKPSKRG